MATKAIKKAKPSIVSKGKSSGMKSGSASKKSKSC